MKKLYFIFLFNILFFLKSDFIEHTSLVTVYKNSGIVGFKNFSNNNIFFYVEYCTSLEPSKGLDYIINQTDLIQLKSGEKIFINANFLKPKQMVFISLENNSQNNLVEFKKNCSKSEIELGARVINIKY